MGFCKSRANIYQPCSGWFLTQNAHRILERQEKVGGSMDKIILPLVNDAALPCKGSYDKDMDSDPCEAGDVSCLDCAIQTQCDADQAILDKVVVESYEAGKAAKIPTVEQIENTLRQGLDYYQESYHGVASAILALFKGE
jgi:hypothetical protein